MSALIHVGRTENPATILEILEEEGCVVVDGALDGAGVAALRAELAPHFSATPHCQGNFYGFATKRLSSLIAKSQVCQDLAVDPLVVQIMDGILLKSCRHYQLNLTQAIQIGPGEPAQIIHRDDLMFPHPHKDSEWMVNCMWAVDDFTAENGATLLVPGSHKWEPARQPKDEEVTQAVMKSGSLLIYMASLLHAGGANRSESARTGVVLSYNLGWLRQAENLYLAIPAAIAATLPERLQRLIGYFVHEPNLGSIEGQDPILLLQGKTLRGMQFREFLSKEDEALLDEYFRAIRQAA